MHIRLTYIGINKVVIYDKAKGKFLFRVAL